MAGLGTFVCVLEPWGSSDVLIVGLLFPSIFHCELVIRFHTSARFVLQWNELALLSPPMCARCSRGLVSLAGEEDC